jgi:hypothetical protein
MDIPPAHFQTPFTVQITTTLLSTLLAPVYRRPRLEAGQGWLMVADNLAQACENSIIGRKMFPTRPMVRNLNTAVEFTPLPNHPSHTGSVMMIYHLVGRGGRDTDRKPLNRVSRAYFMPGCRLH